MKPNPPARTRVSNSRRSGTFTLVKVHTRTRASSSRRSGTFALAKVFLFLFSLSSLAVAQNIGAYDDLVSAIRQVRNDTQARIESAVQSEKVREAWQTGKLIDEHILLHKERQNYGEQVVKRLAGDLQTSETELYYMLEFARTYPNFRTSGNLSWGHYETLLGINDAEARKELEQKAAQERWPLKHLREEVRKRKSPGPEKRPEALPEVKPGKPGIYALKEIGGEKFIDLGFSFYYPLAKAKKSEWREAKSPAELYTYTAQVTDIIDGDTFWAMVDLGFGLKTKQKIRFLSIDAPELVSAEGKEAKAYLEKLLAQGHGKILLTSRELDQHGRALAHVWSDGKLVEKEMLDKDQAVRIQE